MPTKIKHNAITNQADLHVNKYHTDTHKHGGTDAIVIEDSFANTVDVKEVLQPTSGNQMAWTDALTVDTVVADTTITSTDGDVEVLGTDRALSLGADAVDGTFQITRADSAANNYPLITKRVSGNYYGRPAYLASTMNFGGHFVGSSPQNSWCKGDMSDQVNGMPKFNAQPTITPTPSYNIGTVINGITTPEIQNMEWKTVSQDSYISACRVTGTRTGGTGSVYVIVVEKPVGEASGGDCIIRQVIPTLSLTLSQYFYTSTYDDQIDGTTFGTTADVLKLKVAAGSALFVLARTNTTTLVGSFSARVELIPCY